MVNKVYGIQYARP